MNTFELQERISENVDSRYRQVIIAAKRAKQILKGSAPKVKSKHIKPTTTALEELANDLIQYEEIEDKPREIIETPFFKSFETPPELLEPED